MALLSGHQNVIRVVEETTAGTFPTNPTLRLLSKQTRSVRLFYDRNLKESADLDDYEVDSFYSITNAYGLEVEYVLHDVDDMTAFWARNSDHSTDSFSFEIVLNADSATPYYVRGTGWRPQTCTLRGAVDGEYVHSVVFTGGVWTDPTSSAPSIGTGSRMVKADITDALRTWSSGAITVGGSAVGALMEDIEVVINHGSTPRYTTGNADPVPGATVFGRRMITGTASFSLDDGASTHFTRVDGLSATTIVIPFGASGQPKITLSGVVFPRWEVELTSDSDVIEGGQEFRALSYAVGTV